MLGIVEARSKLSALLTAFKKWPNEIDPEQVDGAFLVFRVSTVGSKSQDGDENPGDKWSEYLRTVSAAQAQYSSEVADAWRNYNQIVSEAWHTYARSRGIDPGAVSGPPRNAEKQQ